MKRDERGVVTAEAALMMPLLALALLVAAWLVSVALAQVRVADAAREAARSLARGDSEATAVGLAQVAAPGSSVRVSRGDGEVRVEVRRRVDPIGGALRGLPGMIVKDSAVGVAESEAAP